MVVVAYDISDEKRLGKVARFLEKHGVRVQKSVFELDMSLKEANKIFKEIERMIDIESDIFFMYSVKDKEDLMGRTSIDRIF